MMRKELLAARANEVVEVALSHGACLSEAECTIVRDAVLYELMQVEREVWEKVERYYSHQIHYDMDDYPDKFVKWLKSQQQELK